MKTLLSPLRAAVLGVLLAVVPGCIPTLHPLYEGSDLVYRPELVGLWAGKGSSWAFSREGGLPAGGPGPMTYVLAYSDRDGTSGRFRAHLVELGGHLFLDLHPADLEAPRPGLWKHHFVKVHTFYRVDELGDRLELRSLDGEWLEGVLRKTPGRVAHARVDGRLVLTAPTGELRRFVREAAGRPEAWAKESSVLDKSE